MCVGVGVDVCTGRVYGCVHVYVYVHVHVYVHVCMCVRMYGCACTYACMDASMQATRRISSYPQHSTNHHGRRDALPRVP